MNRRIGTVLRHLAPAAIVMGGAWAAIAHAGQPPSPAGPSEAPLAGPRVAQKAAKHSLVERDMGGKLVRLERRPEIAAVALVGLSGAAREPVDRVVAERAKAVSRALWANFDDFLAVQGALQAGDRAGAGPLIVKLRPALADLLEPPLAERVAAALPEARRAEYRRLVAEYADAVAHEDPPGGAAPGASGAAVPDKRRPGGPGAPTPARRMEMNLTLRELAQSLGATVNERKERTDEIVRLAEATPEQEERIRALARAAGEKAAAGGQRGYPTAEARAELMRQIMAMLSPEQRRRLAEGLRPRGGG